MQSRQNTCMSLGGFTVKFILVKAPLCCGKSFQARKLNYQRICWLTSTRALAVETCRITGFTNYQHVPHNLPLSWKDKIIILAPSLYSMSFEFKPFDCLIVDEAESVFENLYRGLCKDANFELGVNVLGLLMQTSRKILFMDGFLKTSALSVAVNNAFCLDDIRLVIGTYRADRGTL